METIVDRTACHPFLVQLLASRLFENRDLAATLDQLAADEMVANFFSVDFQTLADVERALLSEVAREGPRTAAQMASATGVAADGLDVPLYGLTMLGYLTREGEEYRLSNWLFERWLRRRLASG